MESTAKAVAIENNWLFTEIDAQEILLSFLENDSDSNVRNIFKYARKESAEQKSTYMILVKNVEKVLCSGESRLSESKEWFFQQLEAFNQEQVEVEQSQGYFQQQFDILTIMTSTNPMKINEKGLRQLANQAVFFDFASLKALKFYVLQQLSKMVHHDSSPKKKSDEELEEEQGADYQRFKKVMAGSESTTADYEDEGQEGQEGGNDSLVKNQRKHRNYKNQNQQ